MTCMKTDELSDVIDVDDLMTRCLGNLTFAERILNVFQDRCDADLADLEQAIEAHDLEQIGRIAHRLKGACANAAARSMQEKAADLWSAASKGSWEGVSERFGELRREWAHSEAAMASSRLAEAVPAPH